MAKQEVQLTAKDSNEVYWEDVDVSKGVYAKTPSDEIGLILLRNNKLLIEYFTDDSSFPIRFKSLGDIIINCSTVDFYTIPDNRRITTTKPLTVENLKNGDIIGIINNSGEKCYIAAIAPVYGYRILPSSPNDYYEDTKSYNSIKQIFDNEPNTFKSIIKFDTASELHQWLAED